MLHTFDKYTPMVEDKKHPTVIFGDGKTFDTISSAKKIRNHSLETKNTLQHLYPAVADFQRRMCNLNQLVEFFSLIKRQDPKTAVALWRTLRNL